MDICQCKHPSSARGRPSLISANTSGIPQNTTYVHHVLVGAALRVAYGEGKIVSAWWGLIDLLQKQIANISPVRTTARHLLAGILGESPTPSSRRMRGSTTNASLAAYAVFERNRCSRGTNRCTSVMREEQSSRPSDRVLPGRTSPRRTGRTLRQRSITACSCIIARDRDTHYLQFVHAPHIFQHPA